MEKQTNVINQITEHYAAHKDTLIKKMVRRAGTEWAAEDIVQETYYRALKYSDSFRGEELSKWINTIYNNCLREYKNQERGYTQIDDESEEASYECPTYVRHVMKDVYELINTKSVQQKEILFLYFQQEYNAKSISEITEYTYHNVHKIISRFREELRQLYESEV